MDERSFYKPIKVWLGSKGYKVVISGGRKRIPSQLEPF